MESKKLSMLLTWRTLLACAVSPSTAPMLFAVYVYYFSGDQQTQRYTDLFILQVTTWLKLSYIVTIPACIITVYLLQKYGKLSTLNCICSAFIIGFGFGIPFFYSVGGRYSVPDTIALSIASSVVAVLNALTFCLIARLPLRKYN